MIKTKIKKLDNKGATAIEVVISVMILMILLMFLLDLLTIMWKFSLTSQTATEISRISGIQGGIQGSAPAGYPGGNNNYMSASELQTILKNKFSSSGIPDSDWEIVFQGTGDMVGRNGKITATTITPVWYDYMKTYNIVINIKYKWNNVSSIVPGNINQSITSTRPAMSEWKFGYNDWQGE